MNKRRLRIRFAKQGDLKWIGHRDLVRSLERLFRRIGVQLAMSQGFHPRPLMTFPDALAIGIDAQDEVMDLTVLGEVDEIQLREDMNASAPAGLVIHEVRLLGDNDRKVKLQSVEYAAQLSPDTDFAQLEQQIARLREQATLTVNRREKRVEFDLGTTLERLCVHDGQLQMSIRVTQQSQLQPRDILAAIGLPDTAREGAQLTRTKVELST